MVIIVVVGTILIVSCLFFYRFRNTNQTINVEISNTLGDRRKIYELTDKLVYRLNIFKKNIPEIVNSGILYSLEAYHDGTIRFYKAYSFTKIISNKILYRFDGEIIDFFRTSVASSEIYKDEVWSWHLIHIKPNGKYEYVCFTVDNWTNPKRLFIKNQFETESTEIYGDNSSGISLFSPDTKTITLASEFGEFIKKIELDNEIIVRKYYSSRSILCFDGEFVFDAEDPEKKIRIHESNKGTKNALFIDDHHLLQTDGYLFKFDFENKKIDWKNKLEEKIISHATPRFYGILGTEKGIISLDIDTGEYKYILEEEGLKFWIADTSEAKISTDIVCFTRRIDDMIEPIFVFSDSGEAGIARMKPIKCDPKHMKISYNYNSELQYFLIYGNNICYSYGITYPKIDLDR